MYILDSSAALRAASNLTNNKNNSETKRTHNVVYMYFDVVLNNPIWKPCCECEAKHPNACPCSGPQKPKSVTSGAVFETTCVFEEDQFQKPFWAEL